MNDIDLENLPYPMFETTEGEKEVLKLATANNFSSFFLCIRLNRLGAKRTLLKKVRDSLQDEDVLEYFMFGGVESYESLPDEKKDYFNNYDTAYELRNIWIRKLLEYKGDKSPSSVA